MELGYCPLTFHCFETNELECIFGTNLLPVTNIIDTSISWCQNEKLYNWSLPSHFTAATSTSQLGVSRGLTEEIIGANQSSNRLVLPEKPGEAVVGTDSVTPVSSDLVYFGWGNGESKHV